MAQKTVVVLEDDIDGGEAVETISFSLDGTAYAIDVNKANASALRAAFAPWMAVARRVGRAPRNGPAGRRSRPRSGAGDPGTVRAWGKSHGFQVSGRGRISAELQNAYDAAH